MSYYPGQGPQNYGQGLPGSQPTVYTSPGGAPERKRSRRGLWIGLIIVILLLVGGVTAGVVFLVTAPSRAVNTVVQNYYNAVEHQDYPLAYTYLDQQAYIVNTGQQVHLTQLAYTATSSATDLVSGKLTAYTINNIAINGDVAQVTVSVTRGGATRQVDVELQNVNGTWEIDKIAQV